MLSHMQKILYNPIELGGEFFQNSCVIRVQKIHVKY